MSLSTASSSSAAAAAAAASTSSPSKFDLIIYGATGFTGQLAAAYVHKHYHATGLKYALAGRNLSKLQEVRHKILCGGGGADDDAAVEQDEVPLIVADAVQNPESLDDLAASTRVIANYAGTPFIDKALPVVQACVKHGTCYTDITGIVVSSLVLLCCIVFVRLDAAMRRIEKITFVSSQHQSLSMNKH
jgi:short subunit dehydrogenase-like uncharacterized protein